MRLFLIYNWHWSKTTEYNSRNFVVNIKKKNRYANLHDFDVMVFFWDCPLFCPFIYLFCVFGAYDTIVVTLLAKLRTSKIKHPKIALLLTLKISFKWTSQSTLMKKKFRNALWVYNQHFSWLRPLMLFIPKYLGGFFVKLHTLKSVFKLYN